MTKRIEPRTLKGFRDYLPELMLPREQILHIARTMCRTYGFSPIETPALEYAEILLGKGGEESDGLIYRFKDHGDRDVALRFDLTVPFARFAAQHINKIGVPFKRYHFGPVWRGENTAHGRYREFWQCDFDCIGTASNQADIEIALLIHDLLNAVAMACDLESFEIRINNRLLLNGLLAALGLSDKAVLILRSLDKLLKIGFAATCAEMVAKAEITPEQAEKVVGLANIRGTNSEILSQVENQFPPQPQTNEGIAKLRELLDVVRVLQLPEERFRIDLSICRGLDYYTGTIYETFLGGTYLDEQGQEKPLAGFGSICSGGRYDNLAGLYTSQVLQGVGASVGLDRLIAALEAAKKLPATSTPASVLITQFDAKFFEKYQQLAYRLRQNLIATDIFPDAKKIGQQLQIAEKRGFRIAVIAGGNEFSQQQWKVKLLQTREELTVADAEIVSVLRNCLKE